MIVGSVTIAKFIADKLKEAEPNNRFMKYYIQFANCIFCGKAMHHLRMREHIINHHKVTTDTYPKDMPARFLSGHCLLQALWDTFPLHSKPPQRDLIKNMYDGMNKRHPDEYTQKLTQDYIYKGKFEHGITSSYLHVFTQHYKCTVHVVNLEPPESTISFEVANPLHTATIYYRNNHFSSLRDGGASNKFPDLVKVFSQYLYEGDIPNDVSIVELSAAPGHLTKLLMNKKFTPCVYRGGLPYEDDLPKPIFYSNLKQLEASLTDKYSLYICDAARAYNSEEIIDDMIGFIMKHAPIGADVVIKTFGNPTRVWDAATYFEDYMTYRTGCGTEVYYFLKTKHQRQYLKYDDIEAKNLQLETKHSIPIRDLLYEEFVTTFFKMEIYRDNYQLAEDTIKTFKSTPKNSIFEITALTGGPSAAKTKYVKEKYPNALFITPTKKLKEGYVNDHYAAETRHKALSSVSKYDTIVVDEISLIECEYLLILHFLNPKASIIVVGDVHQVPFVPYDKIHFTHITKYGIRNNNNTLYAIPKDICKMINEKYQTRYKTLSKVEVGLCKYEGVMEKLKKFQIICFNDATARKLTETGYNANTITTYQGSREHTIIFYIDSAAVASNLVNRVEWIYTATTRATNQLVLYGNSTLIEQFFNIEPTKIRTYEEISQNYLVNDNIIKSKIGLEPNVSKLIRMEKDPVVQIKTPLSAAEHVVMSTIKPANECASFAAFIEPEQLPAIEDGVLKTNVDHLLQKGKKYTGKRLCPNTASVINQYSGHYRETVRTLVKRYGQKMKPMTKKKADLAYTQLCNGFSRAMTGCSHKFNEVLKEIRATDEELRYHYKEYLIALSKKTGGNAALLNEIKDEFDESKEFLTFVNKQQAKFKSDPGFDTSDKVGQGVAAFSKRVNILLSAYARCLLTKIRQYLRNHKRPVILATFDDEITLNEEFTALVNNDDKPHYQWHCTDVSEWDTKFRKIFTQLTDTLIRALGCPDWLATWFTLFRSKWRMYFLTKDGRVWLEGSEKQFSGNPFTICENTLGNMALFYTIFDIQKENAALFKGDDSAVKAKKIKLNSDGEKFIAATGHVIKEHKGFVGDFAGFIITPHGLFPDALRYTAKFIGKTYVDQEHFNETKTSISQRVAVVRTEYQKNSGVAHLADFYKDLGLTIGTAEILFDFLKSASNIKYEDLTTVDLHVIQPQGEGPEFYKLQQ
jgi:hypothetical protein